MLKKCFCAFLLLFCSFLSASSIHYQYPTATEYRTRVVFTSDDAITLANGTIWSGEPGACVCEMFPRQSEVIIELSNDTSIRLHNLVTHQSACFYLSSYPTGSLFISKIEDNDLYASDGSRWLLSGAYKDSFRYWQQGDDIIIMETFDSQEQNMYQIVHLQESCGESATIAGIVTARKITN
ncbi:MAG: hypothetical protein AAF443_02545 [Chlamydiota bacterium]